MHPPVMNNHYIGTGSGTGSSDMRQMLMSMFMIDSFKSGGSSSGGGRGSNTNIWSMVYVMIAMSLVDKFSLIIPTILMQIQKYIMSYLEKRASKFISTNDLQNIGNVVVGKKVKTSSMTIEVFLNNADNVLGHAILDYVTNKPNSKFVTYVNKTFILSNKEPVLLDEEYEIWIFIKHQNIMSEESAANGLPGDQNGKSMQTIEVYSFQMDMDGLRKYINRIVYDYRVKLQNKLGDFTYYFNALPLQVFKDHKGEKDYSRSPQQLPFTMKQFFTNRKFKNVIGEQSRMIQKRVEFFKNNKRWYDDKGVPYTLGLLLSGEPGGGKTSTIKCIANEMGRHIINVRLTDDTTKSQMENLFFNEIIQVVQNGKTENYTIPIDKRIYVFEDIDCQGCDIIYDRRYAKKDSDNDSDNDNDSVNEKEQTDGNFSKIPLQIPKNVLTTQPIKTQPKKAADNCTLENEFGSEKLSLSCLLNILDGILETPGRIIIMTSNYPGMLDRALIRPGRIDLICEFTKCTNKMIIEFLENFYEVSLQKDEIAEIQKLEEYVWTPAEFTKIMFENFESYQDAIRYLMKNTQKMANMSLKKMKNELVYNPEDNIVDNAYESNKVFQKSNSIVDNVTYRPTKNSSPNITVYSSDADFFEPYSNTLSRENPGLFMLGRDEKYNGDTYTISAYEERLKSYQPTVKAGR